MTPHSPQHLPLASRNRKVVNSAKLQYAIANSNHKVMHKVAQFKAKGCLAKKKEMQMVAPHVK